MSPIIIIHMVLMSFMLITAVTGVVVAKKRGSGWFMKHKKFMGSGVLIGIVGFLTLFIEKIIESESHFQTTHSKIGAVALLLLVSASVVGANLSKLPKNLKVIHKVTGAIAVLLASSALVSGYLLIFG